MRAKRGKFLYRTAFGLLTGTMLAFGAHSQDVVDKTVAVVSYSARSELITYSDLRWHLALQPGTQLETPASDDLKQALKTLIDQRIFALEAQRLPRAAPTEKEVADKI